MTIQEIISNLDRTIEGKEDLHRVLSSGIPVEVMLAKWVQINIDELKRIREDLLKVQA